MPHHMTRPATASPETAGRTIHWARWYDAASWLMSLGRITAVRRETVKLAALQAGESVLDVGCGTGTLTLAAKRRVGGGEVHGIDASEEMIEVARRKVARKGAEVDFRVGLIEQLPFPDGTFDAVLSSLMLHHLPDDLKRSGFSEIRRVLKPGGRLLAADIAEQRGVLGMMMRLVGHRMEEGYMDRLKEMALEAGFSDVETGPMDNGLGYLRATRGDMTKEVP